MYAYSEQAQQARINPIDSFYTIWDPRVGGDQPWMKRGESVQQDHSLIFKVPLHPLNQVFIKHVDVQSAKFLMHTRSHIQPRNSFSLLLFALFSHFSSEQIANSAPMTHDGDGVKVSTQEAKRLDTESTAHLLGQRKLALVIDLDQTIIHATVDRSVGEFMNDTSNPNHQVLKDVGKFFLGADGREMKFEEEEEQKQEQESKQDKGKGKEEVNGKDNTSSSNSSSKSKNKDQSSNSTSPSVEAKIRRATLEGGMWYYVKPRPHLNSFLETLSKKYQLHVYTMGTRSYADCVCKLIDRDGKFFGNRILSRDESGSIQRKSLARLFADTSMVVAIDDRADVWEYSPNLVKVVPCESSRRLL